MTTQLLDYCPALARSAYRPFRGKHRAALKHALAAILTAHEPLLVISGPKSGDFQANCRIGKSILCRHLRRELEAAGRRTAASNLQAMLDIERLLRADQLDEGEFMRQLAGLPEADVYFFDEAHHGFPARNPKDSRLVASYNRLMIRYWEKIAGLLAAGKQIVFITSRHPLHGTYQLYQYEEGMLAFFTAPLIELRPSLVPLHVAVDYLYRTFADRFGSSAG